MPDIARIAIFRKNPRSRKLETLLVIRNNGSLEFPGGGVQHGETPLKAALRELHEETGLTVTSARQIIHDQEMKDGTIKQNRWLFATADYSGSATFNDPDIQGADWVAVEEVQFRPITRLTKKFIRMMPEFNTSAIAAQ